MMLDIFTKLMGATSSNLAVISSKTIHSARMRMILLSMSSTQG
jgi:hypothetical protein